MNKLERTTFEINRELEFFTEKELEMQIGHSKDWWPVALLKELIDNSLDACEVGNISPEIIVRIDDNYFSVQDNGPGISKETIEKSLNYLKRVSDKAYYVSPTRGQVGNALKCVWAAPFVLDGENGKIEVWSRGLHHIVNIGIDRIAQKPSIDYQYEEDSFKNGTLFKIYLDNDTTNYLNSLITQYKIEEFDDEQCEYCDVQIMTAKTLIESYSVFNPHAAFKLYFNEEYDDEKIIHREIIYRPTNPKWKKWRPDNPTPPHWYTVETLRELVAAYINNDEKNNGHAKTVREFVSEFKGISGTAKQKRALDMFGVFFPTISYLHDLINEEKNDIDLNILKELLAVMKTVSTGPKPSMLGVIGKEHLSQWMVKYANVSEESIKYVKTKGNDGLPFIIEVAFGVREKDDAGRINIVGLNFTPTLRQPIQMLQEVMGKMRFDKDDPITLIVHITKPRFEYVDRGKTRLNI